MSVDKARAVRSGHFAIELSPLAFCEHGASMINICHPLKNGEPFPTTFWLACPLLDRLIGVEESADGVRRLEWDLSNKKDELFRYHREHALIRLAMFDEASKRFLRSYRRNIFRSLARGGVGGIRYEYGKVFAKCLHLHMASFLALGRHPSSELLREILAKMPRCEEPCERTKNLSREV